MSKRYSLIMLFRRSPLFRFISVLVSHPGKRDGRGGWPRNSDAGSRRGLATCRSRRDEIRSPRASVANCNMI